MDGKDGYLSGHDSIITTVCVLGLEQDIFEGFEFFKLAAAEGILHT